MNAFLASVEQALNPDLLGKPVIVGGEPGNRGVVICASYEARKLGIRFGLPLAEAYRRLPQAAFLKGDIKIYMDYWNAVQEIFNEYTPLVEPASMDEAYLDLTGCHNRFDKLSALAQSLKNDTKRPPEHPLLGRYFGFQDVRQNRLQYEKTGRADRHR